ncbi:ABC transporter substrate-binding protein [Streptomyces sp. NPDC002889]|uniref:ABC transporter family substrate-binding protein n=1 Tax=Streptomyces sp. NPDC002889 TaxID=3364669 RepID=UPI0036BCE05D
MSQVDAPRGRTCSRTLRSVALLAGGVLALPALAGCSTGDDGSDAKAAAQDIAATGRDMIADGGTLRWAVDTTPVTLNAFQADADATTSRIAGAVLPTLFTLDDQGRPQRNPDFLESAKVVEREPQQVVLYKLNQQAVWSDGREIGAPDFVSQWRALSGKDSSYWTARNAGYERIAKIERGANDLEVKVTFTRPYADWQSLFTPLYPKEVTGSPAAFNDGARGRLKTMAGPFRVSSIDRAAGTTTLVRNPRWWGRQAKLERLVLTAVPRDKRLAALTEGKLDLAEIDRSAAERISMARRDAGSSGRPAAHGPGSDQAAAEALESRALADGSLTAEAARQVREQLAEAQQEYGTEQKALRRFVVRKSLEPAYTQLALNGESGPLADERVRRAVARALDRKALAENVLAPLGLPAEPPGSHLALAGQHAYADNSGALGEQNTKEALALLADAGWKPVGALKKSAPAKAGGEAGAEKADDKPEDTASDEGLYIVGDDKPEGRGSDSSSTHILAAAPGAAFQSLAVQRQAALLGGAAAPARGAKIPEHRDGMAGAYAPPGSAAPQPAAPGSAAPMSVPPGSSAPQPAAPQPAAPGSVAPQPGVPGDAAPQPAAPGSVAPQPGAPGDAGLMSASPGSATPRSAAPGSAAPKPAPVGGALGKNGKPLSLRFVLPSGPGSQTLRAVGGRIARMLDRIGVRTEITNVADESYFKDHIASGEYDLALYSWPATAYPATDARPIYAKPRPASDGSLLVEQNYTRVGTDYIDQLFDQAAGELDEDDARDLVRRADARIWAAAGSIPLYQRPELVAAVPRVVNAGAFGFGTPQYQDIGFKKPQAKAKAKARANAGQNRITEEK